MNRSNRRSAARHLGGNRMRNLFVGETFFTLMGCRAYSAKTNPPEVITMKSRLYCFALLSVTAIVSSAPVHAATLTRTFVSSSGVDTNPCTRHAALRQLRSRLQPCAGRGHRRSTRSGKYGPLTITGPVTINGNGWSAITATGCKHRHHDQRRFGQRHLDRSRD